MNDQMGIYTRSMSMESWFCFPNLLTNPYDKAFLVMATRLQFLFFERMRTFFHEVFAGNHMYQINHRSKFF